MTDSTDMVRASTILIVDDEPANVSLLERILKREGFKALISTTEPREALRLFREHPVDLVLLDLMMPDLDGFALLETFARPIPENSYLPILVLTADATLPTRRRALSLGAKDFLTKPFDAIEAVLRIFNLLETRILTLELAKHGAGDAEIGTTVDPSTHILKGRWPPAAVCALACQASSTLPPVRKGRVDCSARRIFSRGKTSRTSVAMIFAAICAATSA